MQASSGGAWASASSEQLGAKLGESSLQPHGLRMRPSNELAAPEGLSWDGDTAKWNAVTDATGYSVQLYKTARRMAIRWVSRKRHRYQP